MGTKMVTFTLECVLNPENSRFPIAAVEQGTESPVYMLARTFSGGWVEWENLHPQWSDFELEHIQFPNAERKEAGRLVLVFREP